MDRPTEPRTGARNADSRAAAKKPPSFPRKRESILMLRSELKLRGTRNYRNFPMRDKAPGGNVQAEFWISQWWAIVGSNH